MQKKKEVPVERQSIIQVEFFHVGANRATSLEGLMAECVERVCDGAAIKTHVRFFDDGTLTKGVKRHYWIDRHRQIWLERAFNEKGLYKKFLFFLCRRLARRLWSLEVANKALAVERLRKLSRSEGTIAVERINRSFRLARPDEVHELVEVAEGAYHAWIWVFEPADLLANPVKKIVHQV